MKKEILRMSNICLKEGVVEIVRDGAIHIFESEIVGLVGKNHAGKSSLMGASTGEFPCDSGEIWIDERNKKIESIQQARKEGIFLIKDESSLINEFTIKDTMKLNFAFAEKKMNFSEYFKKCKEILKFLNVNDDHSNCIQNLNFYKKVLIEIAQALICDSRILVLDNVMSMLSCSAREEIGQVFQMLQLRGISIVLVENQVDCIRQYLSRLYIMRRGRIVAELKDEEMQEELILSLTEGERFTPRQGKLHKIDRVDEAAKILEFKNVYSADGVIRNLSFVLYADECLGLWNRNRHSGQGILDIVEGKVGILSGQIWMEGRYFDKKSIHNINNYGLLTLPETDELYSNMSLGENIQISAIKKNSYGGIIPKTGELRYLVQDLCSEYLSDEKYRLFSNQRIPNSVLIKKKVSLCRAIAAGARIIVHNNSSLKLDIREKEIFQQDILRTQKKRIGQIIIAAQIDDLYPVCNRILQIEEGKISESFF